MVDRNSVVVILVTAPDGQVAESLARVLVEERLVACVNVVPGLKSLYWWEGSVQSSDEVLMLAKARKGDVEAVAARVRELHPYEVPEVVATEVVAGLDSYLDWVNSETERG
jgi:periplasmic divalent cation tolerance protein